MGVVGRLEIVWTSIFMISVRKGRKNRFAFYAFLGDLDIKFLCDISFLFKLIAVFSSI